MLISVHCLQLFHIQIVFSCLIAKIINSMVKIYSGMSKRIFCIILLPQIPYFPMYVRQTRRSFLPSKQHQQQQTTMSERQLSQMKYKTIVDSYMTWWFKHCSLTIVKLQCYQIIFCDYDFRGVEKAASVVVYTLSA